MDYDFGNKRQYRRTLWNYVDKHSEVRKADRRVLYLESPQAEETEFLVRQKGYRPHQLFPVSKSAAECAWIVRKCKERGIHGITAKSGDVNAVVEKYFSEGISFDAVNLDFTGCLSVTLWNALTDIGAFLRPGTIASITILRGREKLLDRVAGPCGGAEEARRSALHACFHVKGGLVFAWPRFGQYRSTAGNQTMLFRIGVLVNLKNVRITPTSSPKEIKFAEDLLRFSEWKDDVEFWDLGTPKH